MPVAVVGSGPEVMVFAVRTVATRTGVVDRLKSRDITGAYVPGGKAPQLLVRLAHHDLAGLWGMAWLYSAGILFIFIGVGMAAGRPRPDRDRGRV
ncbi:hypothetical protein [Streptomyces sp. NPDC001435]|uniref:hypothetical protein n=1 Tax=unclassified Streptomyces TaxID=2593676 RepID=UPI00367D0FA4